MNHCSFHKYNYAIVGSSCCPLFNYLWHLTSVSFWEERNALMTCFNNHPASCYSCNGLCSMLFCSLLLCCVASLLMFYLTRCYKYCTNSTRHCHAIRQSLLCSKLPVILFFPRQNVKLPANFISGVKAIWIVFGTWNVWFLVIFQINSVPYQMVMP